MSTSLSTTSHYSHPHHHGHHHNHGQSNSPANVVTPSTPLSTTNGDNEKYYCLTSMFEHSADRRLMAFYGAFHIGRLLLLSGSFILLAGLMLKFIFLEDRHILHLLTICVSTFGLLLILSGIACVFSACSKATKVRKEEEALRSISSNTNTGQSHSSSTNNSHNQAAAAAGISKSRIESTMDQYNRY